MRSVSISNRHPRLKMDRLGVSRVVALLDAHFRFALADQPTLTAQARLRARRQRAAVEKRTEAESAAPAGDLSLVFLSDTELAALHDRFLSDPSVTDVITFEGTEVMGSAGEICVSADTAARYSAKKNQDFSTELTLYVVHGWLHLAGYDDLRPVKKRRMRAAEARAIALLEEHEAIPKFTLRKR